MQPDPVIEANEICSLGAGDPIVGAVTEPKQSHSAAVIHRKWADFSHSSVRPCALPTTPLLQLAPAAVTPGMKIYAFTL